jgi:arsenate reductase-like glutaredoxin family protein
VAEQTDAKKERYGPEEALAIARKATEIHVAKGKRVVRVDMKAQPSDEELLALLIGPSGYLRAPVIRKGTVLLVGFDEGAYREVLEGRAAREKSR